MRKIKFRAWDKDKKIMIYDNDQKVADYYNLTPGASIHNTIWRIGYFYQTLMQFIGRKDKNGKEIYEEDILQQFNVHGEPMGRYVIESKLQTSCSCCLTIHGWYVECPDEEEIVGNMYENPGIVARS